MSKGITQLGCDSVLFDLDGVLINSTSCIVRHWKDWADYHSLDLDEIMQAAHGIPTIETMKKIAPYLDVEKESAQFTAKEVADTAGVRAIEGACQILGALRDGTWAIVTSGSSALARARLTHAGLPIPRILVTADDVMHGKPPPEPYQVGAQRIGTPVERCVVIEDAPAGIEAGVKAGMHVIGINTTHKREELIENGADIVIDRLTKINIQYTGTGYRLKFQMEFENGG